MIIKLGSGKSSAVMMRYLIDGRRQLEQGEIREPDLEQRHLIYDSLGAGDVKAIESAFRATREVWNKNDGVRVHHASISMNPGDPAARSMSDDALTRLGRDFMERHAPGYDYALFIHRDRQHPHLHLVWNAVDADTGKKFQSTRQKLFDAQRYAREMEGKLGHERVLMPGDPGYSPQRDRLSDAEIHIKMRDQGAYLWKEDLKMRIETAQGMAQSYPDFIARLGKMDVAATERGADRKITYSFLDKDGKQRKTREAGLGEDYTRQSVELKISRGQALDVLHRPGEGHDIADSRTALGTPGTQPGHGRDRGRPGPGTPEDHRDIGPDHRRAAEVPEVLPGNPGILEQTAGRIINREARRFNESRGRGPGWSAANAKNFGADAAVQRQGRGQGFGNADSRPEHGRGLPEGNLDAGLALVRARHGNRILMPVCMDEVHGWRKVEENGRGRKNDIRQGADSRRAHDTGVHGRGESHEPRGLDRVRGGYKQSVERNVLRAGASAFAGDGRVKDLLRRGAKAVGERVHRAAGFLVEKFREFGRKIEVPLKVALGKEKSHDLKLRQELKQEEELKRSLVRDRGPARGRDFDLGR